ncbi:Thiosulfate sulfurtransferase 16, chloroplastic [Gracilariopsis chorda]|uniref:Thiosulfate sulfurtransferase 16, chloroplastic n=1 Tax=Gracilariopsis chorda TaxID=448386 RepID=A0A2V3IK71_9FLOR|nr:Thiosulfate sulfurtransferase 16, chloroplastic [Gracilariopsis chorda]|eukprot:PXF42443.1 Thiosulfate sulfurtransferase 16, chloroplastic [Gracilariopsis chorda]
MTAPANTGSRDPPVAKLTLSPREVHDRMTNSSAIYVDVRTPTEFAEGHIPDAINVPLTTPDMKPLPSFVDDFRAAVGDASDIIVGCKSGKRSSNAITQLHQAGFKQLLELEGGFSSWLEDSNLPVAK